jgi:hypothetical protein
MASGVADIALGWSVYYLFGGQDNDNAEEPR